MRASLVWLMAAWLLAGGCCTLKHDGVTREDVVRSLESEVPIWGDIQEQRRQREEEKRWEEETKRLEREQQRQGQ